MIIKWMNKKIDERMMKVMNELSSDINDAVYESVENLDIDYDKLAEALSIDPAAIAGELNESEIADYMEVDYYILAEKVDMEDVAHHVNSNDIASAIDIDYDDLAEKIDASDLADHVDFGSVDIEQHIDYSNLVANMDDKLLATLVDTNDIASKIDMSELAAQVYGLFVSVEDISSIISDIKTTVLALRKEEE